MKNVIIVSLLVLVLVMFIANVKKAKELVIETKKRIKHQLDLSNLLESSNGVGTENTTGVVAGEESNEPGQEKTVQPVS
jgi:hypothetical protein